MKAILVIFLLLSIVTGAEESAKEHQVPASIRDIVAIKIPSLRTEDVTLDELVDFIAMRIRGLDPNKSGISFFTSGFNKKDGEHELDDITTIEKKANYVAKDASVDKILMDLAKLYNVEFYVTSVGIVITPIGGRPFPNSKSDKGQIYYNYK